MKVYPKQQLPYAVAGAGMLGGLLRMLLYTRGTDDGGLLIPGHWAAVSLWALTALVMAALILFYSKPVGATLHSPIASALGCFLCAAALAGVTLFQSPGAQTPLDTLIFGLSLAGAAALAYIGICRLRGKQPHYLGHALLCLCFALKMVGQYRTWSADPQLMDYFFLMAAHVGLMLSAYHLTALDAGLGKLQPLWLLGPATIYLCLAGLYRAEHPLFLIACALWLLTNLPGPAQQEGA